MKADVRQTTRGGGWAVRAFASLEVSSKDSAVFSIPEHELVRPIAAGAYGEVWLARNAVGTWRAVKIVRRDQHGVAESFERELKGLQQFEPLSRSHEGLVDILSLGMLPDGAGFYYVMELADALLFGGSGTGESHEPAARSGRSFVASAPTGKQGYVARTLRAELKSRGALPADEVIALGLKLSAALAHLHRNGLVHRDVKPSNILFIGGEPKLADAGLVAEIDDARSMVGTAGYIAPEGPGTAQADIYALGKVLYEAAFGKDRQEFPALPLHIALRPDHALLLETNAILLKACAWDASQRYASAEAMLSDLELLRGGYSIRQKHLRARYWAIGKKAGLASVLCILAFMAIVLHGKNPDQDAQSQIPLVNKLVAEGDACSLSSTPERLRKALEFFREAIRLDPNFVPAHFGVHRVHVALGDFDGSRPVARKLMELAPDSAEAHLAMCYVLSGEWRFQESLEHARRATELPSYTRIGRSRAYLAYGFSLLQRGKPEAALAQYRLAEKIGEKLSLPDPTLEHHLGHPYFAQRQFAEALKHYERSLEIEPRHWYGHLWKGRTYEEMGDFQRAIDEFQARDLSLGKDESATRKLYDELREAAAQGGREGYWRKRLELARKQSPQDLYYIATVYAQLGPPERENAYGYLEQACERKSFTQGLMFDLCWDHNDERFKAIARRIGLML